MLTINFVVTITVNEMHTIRLLKANNAHLKMASKKLASEIPLQLGLMQFPEAVLFPTTNCAILTQDY